MGTFEQPGALLHAPAGFEAELTLAELRNAPAPALASGVLNLV